MLPFSSLSLALPLFRRLLEVLQAALRNSHTLVRWSRPDVGSLPYET